MQSFDCTYDSGKLDNCSLVWYDFRKFGRVIAYVEDIAEMGTFQYRKKGFSKPPTDYYFRPYVIASDMMKIKKHEGLTAQVCSLLDLKKIH